MSIARISGHVGTESDVYNARISTRGKTGSAVDKVVLQPKAQQ